MQNVGRLPCFRLTNKDSCRESHTALARSTECSTNERVERSLFVRVRENSSVVFGCHVGLFKERYREKKKRVSFVSVEGKVQE